LIVHSFLHSRCRYRATTTTSAGRTKERATRLAATTLYGNPASKSENRNPPLLFQTIVCPLSSRAESHNFQWRSQRKRSLIVSESSTKMPMGHHGDLYILTRVIADQLEPNIRVLDVGCGTGRPAAEILAAAGHQVHGIDVSQNMINIARTQVPSGQFGKGGYEDLRLPAWANITRIPLIAHQGYLLSRAMQTVSAAGFGDISLQRVCCQIKKSTNGSVGLSQPICWLGSVLPHANLRMSERIGSCPAFSCTLNPVRTRSSSIW
jgi:hypothetical protein